MKKTIFILLLCISVAAKATTYYVSPTGSNSNPGTISQPWATWDYGFNHITAGDILYIRGGTYTGVAGGSSNKFGVRVSGLNGTSGSHVTISAYPGEVPVLDCSSLNTTSGQNVGIGIYSSSYIDLIGLTVINCTQHAVNAYAAPGFYESNVNYITHTQCVIHHCGDGFTVQDGYNYIYYTNCDVYEIADSYNDPSGALPGSLANGFYCAPAPGTHIYYNGCRAWNCSDDGWDEFGGAGYIEITNCWAFNNGWCNAGGPIASTVGDGSGFKLGPTTSSPEGGFQRILKNCVAAGNIGPGIDQNASSSTTNVPHAIYNSVSVNNKSDGFQYYYDHVSAFKNNISYNNGISYEFGSGSTVDHNSWQNGITISTSDFASTDISELSRPRKADGSLPDVNFYRPASGSKLIDAGVNVGIAYSGTAPDIGAFESQSGTVVQPQSPAFVSASVESAGPSQINMVYDLTLANIVPASSSFSVMVNSVARTISSVAISGTKVQLNLSSPVVNGNTVTVSYTKPATNPIQTSAGGQAISVSAKSVTNNISAVIIPVYVSSVIQNTTPSTIELTYNQSLANIVPAASAFTVVVNSSAVTVSSVSVSGTKALLKLAAAVVNGNVITVAYTKPSSNPLQTATGGQAASLTAQAVTNLVASTKVVSPVTVTMTVSPNHVHKVLNATIAYSASISTQAASITPEILRVYDLNGKLYLESLLVTGATTVRIPVNLGRGYYMVSLSGAGNELASKRIIVY